MSGQVPDVAVMIWGVIAFLVVVVAVVAVGRVLGWIGARWAAAQANADAAQRALADQLAALGANAAASGRASALAPEPSARQTENDPPHAMVLPSFHF